MTIVMPPAFRRVLARCVEIERTDGRDAHAELLMRHYTEVMPRMRAEQLAPTPGSLLHVPLEWSRLPRLSAAIERLFDVLADARVDAMPALGTATPRAFRAATPTLAALHARTHYGGFMPLLYAYPADLAYIARRARERGLDAQLAIDRYLTAPVVHELCHLGRTRDAMVPHLDECIGGWLGVLVHRELAYPTDGEDDAIYASPWLAQVGQAIARRFGIRAVVRAHAGLEPLPEAFLVPATRLYWQRWRADRSLHLLCDTFDPAPWLALALAGELPPDAAFDRAVVADALHAMTLVGSREGGTFHTRVVLPVTVTLDLQAGRVTTAQRGEPEPRPGSGPAFMAPAPSYWLPPSVTEQGDLVIATLDDVPRLAARLVGSPA